MTIVWAGLSVGAVYVIIALGYNITVALGGAFNFAQGVFVVFGCFFSWFLIADQGWPWWVASLVGVVGCGLIATVAELLAVRPVINRKGSHALLVTTVGVFVVIEGLLLATWGDTPKSVAFFGGEKPLTVLGGRLVPVDLWLIGIAAILAVVLQVLSRRTTWGLAARGATSDPEAAKARGINVTRLRTAAFALAGGVAGLLGPFVAPKTGVTVSVAITLTIFGFVALAMGGFGSFTGCFIGGSIVGLIQALSSRYLGADYPPIIMFAVLLGVLLLKPTGILGQRDVRVV